MIRGHHQSLATRVRTSATWAARLGISTPPPRFARASVDCHGSPLIESLTGAPPHYRDRTCWQITWRCSACSARAFRRLWKVDEP